jgi:hypothetical protein
MKTLIVRARALGGIMASRFLAAGRGQASAP